MPSPRSSFPFETQLPRRSDFRSVQLSQQTGRNGGAGIVPDSHRGVHRQKAESGVEGLGARIGVEDHLLVAFGSSHDSPHDRRTQAVALMIGMDGNVGDVRES